MFYERKYQIIDSHMHICGYNKGDLPGILKGIREIKERAGLAAINVAALPGGGPDRASQNALCILFKALYPDSYAYAGIEHFIPGIDRSPEGRREQLEQYMEMGFDGVKLIDGKPTARKLIGHGLNTPGYAEFFDYAEKHAIPILWHVADPEENWDPALCSQDVIDSGWSYTDGSFLSKEALMRETEDVLEAHPNLNVVFAHLYFMSADIKAAGAFMRRFPNVKLDVTPGIEMYYNFDKQRVPWFYFFSEYQNRILLGTDNGWGDHESPAQKVADGCRHILFLDAFFTTKDVISTWDARQIRGLELPGNVWESMCYNNFMEMQGGNPPKKVNIKMAADYIRDVYERMKRSANLPETTIYLAWYAMQLINELL